MFLNNLDRVLILSNFDECLEKLYKLFKELNLNSVITKNENYSNQKKIIYLSNFDEDFNESRIVDEIICLEPYYSIKQNIKLYDILKSYKSKILKFLIIKDTIEEDTLKIHFDNNLLCLQ